MKKPSFTLVQILVVIICFFIVLGALYAVYSVGMHYLRMAQVQSRLQQQASVAMQKVSRELSTSLDDAHITKASATPPFVWFLSTESLTGTSPILSFNYDSAGRLEWRKWVCFFLDSSTQQLIRSELPLAGAPQKQPFGTIPAPTLAGFQSAGGATRRMIAEDIDTFSVSRTGPGVFHISIVTALAGVDGKLSKTQLDSEVFILNTY